LRGDLPGWAIHDGDMSGSPPNDGATGKPDARSEALSTSGKGRHRLRNHSETERHRGLQDELAMVSSWPVGRTGGLGTEQGRKLGAISPIDTIGKV
jgi:hypothetical protein